MLFYKPLDSILGQSSKVKILRFLNSINTDINGRELAKAIKLSHVKCHTALRELAQHGIVMVRNVGRSTLYKINIGNIIYINLLKPLFHNESLLMDELVKYMIKNMKVTKPLSLIIFGSTIDGTSRPDSDLDMLIIYPNLTDLKKVKQYIERIEQDISIRCGNQLSAILIKEKKLKQKYKQKDDLYSNIIKTGKVIYGKTISELL
jgi:predicted nucleotidyltransferase